VPYIKQVANVIEITLKVVPGASRSKIVGVLGDALKVQVAAPPEKGKANAAVIELISATLGVASRQLEIIRGHAQPRKIIRVAGLSAAAARAKLEGLSG